MESTSHSEAAASSRKNTPSAGTTGKQHFTYSAAGHSRGSHRSASPSPMQTPAAWDKGYARPASTDANAHGSEARSRTSSRAERSKGSALRTRSTQDRQLLPSSALKRLKAEVREKLPDSKLFKAQIKKVKVCVRSALDHSSNDTVGRCMMRSTSPVPVQLQYQTQLPAYFRNEVPASPSDSWRARTPTMSRPSSRAQTPLRQSLMSPTALRTSSRGASREALVPSPLPILGLSTHDAIAHALDAQSNAADSPDLFPLSEDARLRRSQEAEDYWKAAHADHATRWLQRHEKAHRFEFTWEQRRLLRKWFNSMDSDGSGDISVDELEDPLLSTGIAHSRAEVQTLFNHVDHDGSGEIGFESFLEVLNPDKLKKKEVDNVMSEEKARKQALAVERLKNLVCRDVSLDISSVVNEKRRQLLLDTITTLYSQYDRRPRGISTESRDDAPKTELSSSESEDAQARAHRLRENNRSFNGHRQLLDSLLQVVTRWKDQEDQRELLLRPLQVVQNNDETSAQPALPV